MPKFIRVTTHQRAGKVVKAHTRKAEDRLRPSGSGQELLKVKSSFIKSLHYDAGKQTAFLQMANGTTYSYPGFPPALWEKAKKQTGSFGEFYNKHIKNKFG